MAANFRNISNGIGLVPNAGSVVTSAGDVAYNSVSSSLEIFTSAAESVTTTDNTQTLTHKTLATDGTNLIGTSPISGVTGTGSVTFSIAPTMKGVNIVGGETAPSPCFVIRDTTATNVYFSVLSNGFVGIGDANPTHLLEVSGNINGFISAIGNNNTTVGQSNGLRIVAGKDSSDTILLLRNSLTSANVFSVAGDGAITSPFLSGSNTGDVTLNAVGSSPSANGATLSGQSLTLQPADATHPGLLTSGTQTIGGNKTFTGSITFTGSSVISPIYNTDTVTMAGPVDGLDVTNRCFIELGGGVTLLRGFANGVRGQMIIINNTNGSAFTIKNQLSGFQPIVCPNTTDIVLNPQGSATLVFNGSNWKVTGLAN